jgi:hypothetical protein
MTRWKMIPFRANARLNRRRKDRYYINKGMTEQVREHDCVFLIESLYG